ncbi:DUF551 domain-containing protein [Klebsiella pneumoniae]|nr:DUF551 domain-containing protein [Klebsiella pneumoniae]MCH0743486.1 DUF551 domain-containing protein [Klebsiella pneumoniae]
MATLQELIDLTPEQQRQILVDTARHIISRDNTSPYSENLREIARIALAAMDSSESVELPLDYLQGHKDGLEWASQLAEANHPETGDWLYDDPIELAKAIRKGPDMPPSQPALDSEPVALQPELAKVIYHFRDWNEGFPVERFKADYVISWMLANYPPAQPAPVVPDDVLEALQKVARIRLDLDEFDGDRRGIADCLGDAEEALIEVVNRRAAMLAAAPQSPGSEPATVPGKWIPVSEQMPEIGDIVLTSMGGVVNVGETECSAANCRFFTSVISGRELPATHWMPLPAGPQEVKGV